MPFPEVSTRASRLFWARGGCNVTRSGPVTGRWLRAVMPLARPLISSPYDAAAKQHLLGICRRRKLLGIFLHFLFAPLDDYKPQRISSASAD